MGFGNMKNNASIREKVVKAVEEFNRYGVSEAKARLILLDEESFKERIPPVFDRRFLTFNFKIEI